LQNTLIEDILTQVLPCVPVGKRCPRAYLVGDEKSASIQVIVAMLVQMIQVRMQSAMLASCWVSMSTLDCRTGSKGSPAKTQCLILNAAYQISLADLLLKML